MLGSGDFWVDQGSRFRFQGLGLWLEKGLGAGFFVSVSSVGCEKSRAMCPLKVYEVCRLQGHAASIWAYGEIP